MSNVKAYLEDIVRDGLHDIAEALKGSGPSGDVQASHVIYDNTASGLTSNRVQGAIDELSTKVDTNASGISDLTTRMGTAEGDITSLDGRLDTAEGDITSLDGRLDTAEGDITALETWKDNLDASDIPYDSGTVKEALDSSANKVDIATVEPGSTASRAYSVGELVYVNGNLYKVKTDISQGSSFTAGTNIELTNVSERINDISAEDVSYGGGTVKDALDELTSSNSGGTIILTTTPYETEADGYVWVYMGNANHTYSVRIRSKDNIDVAYLRGQSSIGYEYHSLYVKKGMKIVCDSEQSLTDGDKVWFKPLTD